jgi:uncharacterized membrane protein affecting hemolysin expression
LQVNAFQRLLITQCASTEGSLIVEDIGRQNCQQSLSNWNDQSYLLPIDYTETIRLPIPLIDLA